MCLWMMSSIVCWKVCYVRLELKSVLCLRKGLRRRRGVDCETSFRDAVCLLWSVRFVILMCKIWRMIWGDLCEEMLRCIGW